MQQSKDFVLVCTPNAMKSEWVKDEYKAFYHEIYKKSRKERRFIILEGKGFDISLVPLLMRRLQVAGSVDEIIGILAGRFSITPERSERSGKKKVAVWLLLILLGATIGVVFTFIELKNQNYDETQDKVREGTNGAIKKSPEPGDTANKESSAQKINTKNEKTGSTADNIKRNETSEVGKEEIFAWDVDETIREFVKNLNKPGGAKISSKPAGQEIYVTHLTFMDGYTHSTMVQTELAALSDEAVIKGMDMVKKNNDDLVINAAGHKIFNNDANVDKLVSIISDPNLIVEDRVKKIITEMMTPNGVDVIVTGQYIDDARNPLITVRPFIVIRFQQKIITKNLQYKKDEFECKDPISKKTILCKGAFDEIAEAVKELLEQV